MKSEAASQENNKFEVSVYECEIRLKFRLIEEKCVLSDRQDLLELLLDAFMIGSDDYLESMQADVEIEEISDFEASPPMRRQLMRLRNSSELA